MLRRISAYVLGATILFLLSPHQAALAGSTAKKVKLRSNGKAALLGNIKQGKTVDLAWATKSSVACFPSVQNKHFSGKHLFYAIDLPRKSVLKIKLVPKKESDDLSLYAYSVGPSNEQLPPHVSSVVSCEASYGSNSIKKPYNPGENEEVELNATTNPYRVVVGVAGAKKLEAADFTLKFDLKTAPAAKEGSIEGATPLALDQAGKASRLGKIDAGTEIDLAWAAKSSVACFPATRFEHFDGNHVLYRFDLPKYTTAKIELVPKKPDLDLSLYAYTLGTTNVELPPDVNGVVSCEASYGSRSISNPYNPGEPEEVELVAINNPYNAFIGVAGARGLKKGDFQLKVTTRPR